MGYPSCLACSPIKIIFDKDNFCTEKHVKPYKSMAKAAAFISVKFVGKAIVCWRCSLSNLVYPQSLACYYDKPTAVFCINIAAIKIKAVCTYNSSFAISSAVICTNGYSANSIYGLQRQNKIDNNALVTLWRKPSPKSMLLADSNIASINVGCDHNTVFIKAHTAYCYRC